MPLKPVKSNDLCNSLLLNTADAVIVSDSAGNITYVNPAFVKLIGAQEDEIIGHRLNSFILADWLDSSTVEEESKSGAESNGTPRPATILTKSGTEFVMPAAHFIAASGSDNMTIVYVVQANSLQQAQTEFVSTVSHELRTPLTSIKGFADTILRAGDRLEVAQQRRYVGIIRDQADRLTRLVEDLLAVSRLESKKLQLTVRALDLREAIERVEQNLSDKAKNHTLVVQVPAGLTPVWADADRLEQILTNLVDNAIKYSPQGTTVTVSATVAPADEKHSGPEMIEFAVKDQGVGIPEEHLPQVFSKFGRLDNPLVRQTEGTGLGLYITRSLVLALGVQIHVTSVPGCTTFTVRLPAATFEQQVARGRGD